MPPTLSQIKGRCRIDSRTECWEWANCIQGNGYGRITVDRKTRYVHRYVWELLHGPIQGRKDVCHECDNRKCCNPDHLFLGTRLINMRDAKDKGRLSSGVRHSLVTTPAARGRAATKLSPAKAAQIRQLHASGETTAVIAEQFNVDPSNVRLIIANKAWKERSPFSL